MLASVSASRFLVSCLFADAEPLRYVKPLPLSHVIPFVGILFSMCIIVSVFYGKSLPKLLWPSYLMELNRGSNHTGKEGAVYWYVRSRMGTQLHEWEEWRLVIHTTQPLRLLFWILICVCAVLAHCTCAYEFMVMCHLAPSAEHTIVVSWPVWSVGTVIASTPVHRVQIWLNFVVMQNVSPSMASWSSQPALLGFCYFQTNFGAILVNKFYPDAQQIVLVV